MSPFLQFCSFSSKRRKAARGRGRVEEHRRKAAMRRKGPSFSERVGRNLVRSTSGCRKDLQDGSMHYIPRKAAGGCRRTVEVGAGGCELASIFFPSACCCCPPDSLFCISRAAKHEQPLFGRRTVLSRQQPSLLNRTGSCPLPPSSLMPFRRVSSR